MATARIDVGLLIAKIERLNRIGVALSQEPDPERLLEVILLGAKELTDADGGSFYSRVGEDLHFQLVRNDTLRLAWGGPGLPPPALPPVKLSDAGHSVVARAVATGQTVNVADAYAASGSTEGFDFSGTHAFDRRTGYRSTSFLTVPLRNHEGYVIGALQLINARDREGQVEAFTEADQRLVESLASQAATTLTKRELIQGMAGLFDAFVELIATAIDEKSPYTGGHCRRVPELTMALAEAASRRGLMPFSPEDRYELKVAAWLHDCGKITTPEWVMDKATKLHGLSDRIQVVEERFARLAAEAEAACWRAVAEGAPCLVEEGRLAETRLDLANTVDFLKQCNLGGESMRPEDQERITTLVRRGWLLPDEARNLAIPKGTLLPEERQIINGHMTATLKMLEKLPFPKHLRRVPEYAGGHHEHMDGTGYPKGLTRGQMSVPARIMGIADVFEALTAGDRPYKKAMKLSQSLAILARMAETGHIDPELYQVFIEDRVWVSYAQRFLQADQIDIHLT
jgi:HD-GYP domain-containing protein (c-di-GMP phosphodiesterase class II)